MFTARIRRRIVVACGKRVAFMNEMMTAIRLIKMYAWEEPFMDRLKALRAEELRHLRSSALVMSINMAINPSVTLISAIVTFVTLTGAGHPITAPEAFTLFSVFTSLQFTIGSLNHTMRAIAECKVALSRLSVFLDLPEHVQPAKTSEDLDKDVALKVSGGNLGWYKGTTSKKGEASIILP